MAFNYAYKRSVKLQHNEVPARINLDTGEVKPVDVTPKTMPNECYKFEPKASFRKDYTNSWLYLRRKLTPIEYKAAHTLAMMARANTNSLEPLSDSTTLNELQEVLGVSINKVKPILNRLFDLGVYAKFEMVKADIGYTKYWAFNPYLSFSGQIIYSDIARLFRGTHCEKAFNDPYYNEG